MRIAIGVEYDGSAYNGWQRQKTGLGVQEVLERAISTVADEVIELTCAGRTDTGVHALGQVAHFDASNERSNRGWLLGSNSSLPDDVNVTWVQPVPDSFDARYSATARTYRYWVLNRVVRSALQRRRAWWFHEPLNVETMRDAAAHLLGEHDFSAFRAAGCQARNPQRRVDRIDILRRGDWISITVTANAFLQHMVRNLTGVLVGVGSGAHPPEWAADVLASRDRRQGGVTAPAHGLTLMHVDYPEFFGIPAAAGAELLPGGAP